MNDGAQDRTIRVLVVDDHDLFRTGLSSYLGGEPDIEVVAQASGGRMGVRLARELVPDVILMDLRMPDVNGPDATAAIIATQPDARVVALTVAADDDDIAIALRAGACAFVVKDSPVAEVAAAVRAAASGSAWLSPRAADAVLGRLRGMRPEPERRPAATESGSELTGRELQVLRLLALGLENAEIAQKLAISPRTVKNHVSSILRKLQLPNRIQAALYAIRNDLT